MLDGGYPTLLSHPRVSEATIDVLAIEGQYVAPRTTHKGGKRFTVNAKTVPTLAFRAGLQAHSLGVPRRLLRMQPDVWRAFCGLGQYSSLVAVNHLRRALGSLAVGHTDDEIEAYGLACAARAVGAERKGVLPDGRAWAAKPQGPWEDVVIPTPRHAAQRLRAA